MSQTPSHELREIERSRLKALVDRNMALALQLHAKDFQLITPGGKPFTREEYLGKIESGTLQYLRWDPGHMSVRVHGDAAVLRYQADLQLNSPEGPGVPFSCWHIDTYERIDDRWQVVWSQATAIRTDAP